MSLEQALNENTAAVKELIAALKAGGGKAATTSKPKDETPAAKHTKEEMMSMVSQHKDKLGVPKTRELVKTVTGKDKMDQVDDPAAIDKLYAAAKAAIDAAAADDGV